MAWWPSAPWVWWTCAIAALTYAATFAAVVVGRVRDARRRRVLDEANEWLTGAREPSSDAATRRKRALDCLAAAPARVVERLAIETAGVGDLPQALAESLLHRLGWDTWKAIACDRRRGQARWRRVLALRVIALARPDDAVLLLEAAVQDPDQEVRGAAAALLGQLPYRWAAELLVAALVSGPHARSRIATALEASPVDVADLLVELLADPRPAVRYWSAVLMRRHPTAVGLAPALEGLARDDDPPVRKAAVDTLAAVGGDAALRAARRALSDETPFVRAHAALALGTLHARDAAGAVVPLLADRDWHVRSAAKRSLEAMGAHAAAAVVGALEHTDAFARNGAAEVLHHLGTFERLLALEAQGPPDAERRRALRLLAQAGGARIWEATLERLDPPARGRARALLGELDVQPTGAPPAG